ncbi:uncharacterized protein LOC135486721 isoform X1 [Lineus longissimus]|uniref:uncharacterized protein LOC135486721 isoform X1 n=1 Tax=Lineus longissimus TaxID=88925 RepID=UPI002B4E95F1
MAGHFSKGCGKLRIFGIIVTSVSVLVGFSTCRNVTCSTECRDDGGSDPNCFCDRFCSVYNDCCKDYNSAVKVSDEHHVELRKAFRCTPGDGSPYGDFVSGRILVPSQKYVVATCPSWYKDPTMKSKCEHRGVSNLFLFLPVTSKKYGIMYKNVFCSMCWGDSDVLYWKISAHKFEYDVLGNEESKGDAFRLKEIPPAWRTLLHHFKLNETSLENVDGFMFESPIANSLRSCDPVVNSCPDDWSEDGDKVTKRCRAYTSYVYAYTGHQNAVKYSNKDCAKCNNISDFHCSFDNLLGATFYSDPAMMTGFSSIVTLFDLDHIAGGGLFTDPCKDTEVYDPISEKCRFLFCFTLEGQSDELCTGNCTYVTFDQWEYTINANDSVYINKYAALISGGDYVLKNRSLLICEHIIREIIRAKFPFTSGDTAKGIVSLIGQILSMIGLVIHLVASMIFQSLRRIPVSKAIMSLDVSLLLGQVNLLVGSGLIDQFLWCKIAGILVHYFFLVSFMWMNVLAFDLASTFASTSIITRDYEHATRRFVKYSVYAWFTPVLIVAVAITFNEADLAPNLRPLYGKFVCWFGNPSAQLVFFLIPVAIVLVANLVLFMLTLYGICTVQKQAKAARKGKKDKYYLFIYFKLFVIMGLTWLFGFIGTVSNSEPIWYLFIVFNSMQGLFICFVFLCRKNIWHQVTEKCTGSKVIYRRARNSLSSSSGKRVTQTSSL